MLFYVHGHAEQASLPTLAVPPAISINAAMVGLVDHASHAIWDTGIEGQAPQTDRDWETIAHYAIQLATAGTWITLGGTGPEDAGWVQQPNWATYTREMTDGALAALEAAHGKNLDALSTAGDQIVEACERCHTQYKPDLPTEGITHPHH